MPSPLFALRLSPAELAELKAEAKKAGLSVSDYVRRVLDLDATKKIAKARSALAVLEGGKGGKRAG
jgi:formylmethanofuran dehydrogenase subunit B